MPLPKKRHSAARGRQRRTHWKVTMGALAPCPQCKSPKRTHRACPVCGYYSGRQAIEIKVKEEKKPAK